MHRGGYGSESSCGVGLWERPTGWEPEEDLGWEARLICGIDPELEADFRTLVEAQAEASLSMGRSR